jgi:hypothetical protein
MKTVTTKTKAWVTPYSGLSPDDLAHGRIGGLTYHDCTSGVPDGWTLAGEAEITVHLVDTKTLIANKVEALRQEAKAVRAEATAKCTRIEGQIQNLLALSFDGEQA